MKRVFLGVMFEKFGKYLKVAVEVVAVKRSCFLGFTEIVREPKPFILIIGILSSFIHLVIHVFLQSGGVDDLIKGLRDDVWNSLKLVSVNIVVSVRVSAPGASREAHVEEIRSPAVKEE